MERAPSKREMDEYYVRVHIQVSSMFLAVHGSFKDSITLMIISQSVSQSAYLSPLIDFLPRNIESLDEKEIRFSCS